MQRIFSSPHIIDLVVVLTVLEAIGLLLARQRFLRRLFLPRQRPSSGSDHDVESGIAAASPPRPVGSGETSGADGGMRPIGIVLMLLPGLLLMLAIRAALDGAAWPWVPAALAASLLAHLADLRERWFG